MLGKLSNWLFEKKNTTGNGIKKILEEIQSSETTHKLEKSDVSFLADFGVKIIPCSHKTGVVTHIDNDNGIINGLIYFKLSQVSAGLNLSIGDEVAYTVFRNTDNETDKVDQIYALKRDSWEVQTQMQKEIESDDLEILATFHKLIIGQVSRKEGRMLFIEPQQLCCDLDKVHTSFVPMAGDWLAIKSTVAINPESVDLSGDIVNVYSIDPTIKKKGSGRVTYWSSNKNQGAIENKIYFTKSYCSTGYIPSLGDEVTYIAIESNQESYKLRALMVLPKEAAFKAESQIENILDLVTCSDEISIKPISIRVDIEMNETKEIVFEVSNIGSSVQELKRVTTTGYINSDQVQAKGPHVDQSVHIEPNKTINVNLEACGRHFGYSEEFCVFEFEGFHISKLIVVNVMENRNMKKLFDSIKGPSDFNSTPLNDKINLENSDDLRIMGSRPWPQRKFQGNGKFKWYKLPDKLIEIVGISGMNEKTINIEELEKFAPCLKHDLNASSYVDRFHYLLWLEEIAVKRNYSRLKQTRVVLYKQGEYLTLDMPTLRDEKALLVGDKVIVKRPWLKERVSHVGYIHKVLSKSICIRFHDIFHQTYDESVCDVTFEPATGNLMRAHNAVSRSWQKLGKPWLFPSKVSEKPVQLDFDKNKNILNSNRKLVWKNKSLNEMQKYAVMQALKGQGRPLPFLIFGPPGTGKTVTLIELVIQIYHLIPGSRILLTSPSNSSADLLCKLLIEVGKFQPGELVRYMAYHRVRTECISPELMPYIGLVQPDNNMLNFTNMVDGNGKLIGRQRINVGTCSCFGSLHQTDLPQGHFTHVLVDEAGQVSEPEVLIPISLLDKTSGQVVLAGDPQQLGPVCLSHLATSYGLGVSLMERLLNSFPYQKDIESFLQTSGYDPRFVIKLKNNYRSVPEILDLPNEMFYNMELIPMVSDTQGPEADIIKKFNFMGKNRDKPAAIIFHSVVGQKCREADTPSWYNPHEIWQIVLYLKQLYDKGMKCDDIGIISPYLKQVKMIKSLLTKLDLAEPKIGTVHDFQGQERKVIIVSTVRSDLFKEPEANNIYSLLGFVSCPRLLNVAITRARALLILLGNAKYLSRDPYWKTVLQYCVKNGCLTGANLKVLENIGHHETKEEEEV